MRNFVFLYVIINMRCVDDGWVGGWIGGQMGRCRIEGEEMEEEREEGTFMDYITSDFLFYYRERKRKP